MSVDQLFAWCGERLANNKVRRTILILDELPLNATGKILKRDLIPLLDAAAQARRQAAAR